MHGKGLSQPMLFPPEYHNHELAGKPKGIGRALKERRLWPEPRGLVLECPTTHNRPGRDAGGGCCARRVLGAERDFQNQRGRLQEEVEALGHRVLFYLKFHCELNFVEHYWCQAEWFAREDCGYDFEALKAIVPEALASVSNVSIRRFYRLELHAIDAYSTSMQYGAEEFKQIVYNRIAR